MAFNCKFAITSMSLGRAWSHDLEHKLDQAKRWGITGIELFYEDLEFVAKRLPGGLSPENEITAARIVRELCDERRLTVICVQPLWCDEGSKDENARVTRLAKTNQRIEVAKILGTDLILIPSSMTSVGVLSGDHETIANDLREVADIGNQQDPPIRFAFESLCWGTHINTWQDCWDIVGLVDQPNFGICLDTFNIAGRVYADPTTASGTTPNAIIELRKSLRALITTVELEKVFLVQLVDGKRLDAPLVEGHEYYVSGQQARMSWSRNCRLFYGEKSLGAYLPVEEVAKAIFHDLGFLGWVSMELFNHSLALPDNNVPSAHAERAVNSWEKLVDDYRFAREFAIFIAT